MKSKLAAEKAAMDASQDTTVVVVNPTTVYGPGDRTLNSGALVVKIAQSSVIPVPPGGSNVVDVDDVVEGILAAGERGQSSRRYILGGENLSFGQVFSTIASVVKHRPLMISLSGWMRKPMAMGISVAGRLVNNRFLTPQIVGDLFVFKYYSCTRAKQELGWTPKFFFRESIERAWAFYVQEGLV
jgi:dihydroflavonol-4-reductase